MHGLLVGEDNLIASWAFQTFNVFGAPVNQALGIVDKNGKIEGAALFQNFNGYNIELSYYGRNTLSVGIVRALARVALSFNVSRATVVTSKRNKHLMRSLLKIGFKLEGIQRCYYGYEDSNKNTGVRFVMFKEQLFKIAEPKRTLLKVKISR